MTYKNEHCIKKGWTLNDHMILGGGLPDNGESAFLKMIFGEGDTLCHHLWMAIRCATLCRIVILIQKFRISEQNLSLQSPVSSVTSFGFEQCWEC